MYYRDKKFMEDFGQRLRELRKERGISQEQLALETGFELSQIEELSEEHKTQVSVMLLQSLKH